MEPIHKRQVNCSVCIHKKGFISYCHLQGEEKDHLSLTEMPDGKSSAFKGVNTSVIPKQVQKPRKLMNYMSSSQ